MIVACYFISPTPTFLTSDCSQAIDLALVLDASGSIRDSGIGNWDEVIKFAIDVIDNFDVGMYQTHVSVMTFSTKATVRIRLNEYTTADDLKKALNDNKENWYVGGWTNTNEALLKVTILLIMYTTPVNQYYFCITYLTVTIYLTLLYYICL